jgi:caffeoyl-CoA O-methyltransferase
MDIFSAPELLERYLVEHSSPEDPVLNELARYTYLNKPYPNMLAGPVLGGFLSLFSKLFSPARILEIGTYTGYSAICLARGLREGGSLTTIEVNDELGKTCLEYFRKAGLEDQIDLIHGDALEIIPSLVGEFDLVFIDAHKDDYIDYYNLVIDKVSSGGYILADNALWGGKVMDQPLHDTTTRSIHHFNQMVTGDPEVENHLLPIRDGLMVIKKL